MPTSHETRTARGLSVSQRAFSVPATDLADAVRLCDPFTPLDPRKDAVLHEDLSAIRGGDRLGKIVRNVRRAGGTPTLHFVSGHLGSGKTTELLRMKERLETAEGGAPLTTTALIEGLNQAIAEIGRQPPNDEAGPVVVLIDNLEKLSQGQRATVERLYLERMGALKSLEAHLVITVPLYLCYAASGASMIGLYGGEIVVVPMIEVRKRVAEGGGDNAVGLAAMTHLLGRRSRSIGCSRRRQKQPSRSRATAVGASVMLSAS